jgi:hypothetical protein
MVLIPPLVGCVIMSTGLGIDLRRLLACQSACAASVILGWGVGTLSRRFCGTAGMGTALGLCLVTALVVSILPVSHAAASLSARSGASEILLALNPVVAITHGAGYDLLRSEALYDVLSISQYRFQYPREDLPVVLLAGLGLTFGILGRVGKRKVFGRARRIGFSHEEAVR